MFKVHDAGRNCFWCPYGLFYISLNISYILSQATDYTKLWTVTKYIQNNSCPNLFVFQTFSL